VCCCTNRQVWSAAFCMAVTSVKYFQILGADHASTRVRVQHATCFVQLLQPLRLSPHLTRCGRARMTGPGRYVCGLLLCALLVPVLGVSVSESQRVIDLDDINAVLRLSAPLRSALVADLTRLWDYGTITPCSPLVRLYHDLQPLQDLDPPQFASWLLSSLHTVHLSREQGVMALVRIFLQPSSLRSPQLTHASRVLHRVGLRPCFEQDTGLPGAPALGAWTMNTSAWSELFAYTQQVCDAMAWEPNSKRGALNISAVKSRLYPSLALDATSPSGLMAMWSAAPGQLLCAPALCWGVYVYVRRRQRQSLQRNAAARRIQASRRPRKGAVPPTAHPGLTAAAKSCLLAAAGACRRLQQACLHATRGLWATPHAVGAATTGSSTSRPNSRRRAGPPGPSANAHASRPLTAPKPPAPLGRTTLTADASDATGSSATTTPAAWVPASSSAIASMEPPAALSGNVPLATSSPPEACRTCGATSHKGPRQQVKLSRCSRCRSAVDKYCSKECQKADWPRHRATCQVVGHV
jgi:hypothetical protein